MRSDGLDQIKMETKARIKNTQVPPLFSSAHLGWQLAPVTLRKFTENTQCELNILLANGNVLEDIGKA